MANAGVPEPDRLTGGRVRSAGFVQRFRRSRRSTIGMRFARPRPMSIYGIFNAVTELARDMRFAVRSLLRTKGLAATVIVTLGLGIGANAAVFSVVRGVLLRPLVNRDEDRLIYIRQSAPGLGIENYTFSMPEIADITSRVTTVAAFGDFSTADLALSGVGGDPRMVKAG